METPLPDQALSEILLHLMPTDIRGFGQWSRLAERLALGDRRALSNWLRAGHVPARRVDAVCDLLAAPAEVRAELRRRAGFQVLPTVVESEIAVQEGV